MQHPLDMVYKLCAQKIEICMKMAPLGEASFYLGAYREIH